MLWVGTTKVMTKTLKKSEIMKFIQRQVINYNKKILNDFEIVLKIQITSCIYQNI